MISGRATNAYSRGELFDEEEYLQRPDGETLTIATKKVGVRFANGGPASSASSAT